MKSFGLPLFATVAICASLSSCADLQKITTYTEASSATLKNKTISAGLPASVQRRYSYLAVPAGDSAEKVAKDRVIREAASNSRKLEKIQGVYDKYFTALGALAKKDINNYKTQFDGFEKSLAGAEWVTKSEATAIRKLAQGITNLATERYRQNEIRKLVTVVDPTLQKGIRELGKVNSLYRESLDREDRASQEALTETLTANGLQKPPLPPYLANSLRNQQVATLEAERKKSLAYDKSIAAIAEGNKVVLRDSGNLRGDEALEALKPQVEQIIEAYKELSK